MFLDNISARLIFIIFLSAAAVTTGFASDSEPRPQLEDYENSEKFVRDLLAWERKQRNTQPTPNTSRKPNQSATDDWHDINGPETLEGALRKARGYSPPDYEAQYRFNRTTHLSFPLPRLEGEQMSGQAITGGLRQQALEQRSLEPLPEMRLILEEAGDEDEFGVRDSQPFLPVRSGTGHRTVQVNAR